MNSTVQIWFDISKPGALMTDYKFMFPCAQSKRNEVMIKMAKRLLNSIETVKKKVLVENEKSVFGFKSWMRRHKKRLVLKRRLKRLFLRLSDWLTHTVCIFGNGMPVKVVDSIPFI